MLDNLKRFLPAPEGARAQSDSTSNASEINSTYSSSSLKVAAILKGTVAAPVAKLSKALFQNFR